LKFDGISGPTFSAPPHNMQTSGIIINRNKWRSFLLVEFGLGAERGISFSVSWWLDFGMIIPPLSLSMTKESVGKAG